MLINCPRCGFSQPKDRYCAQCGVDMDAFKPAQVSWFKKIIDNTLIQVSLVFAIAIFAGFYLYQQKHKSLLERVDYLKGVQVSSTENLPSNQINDTTVFEGSSTAAQNVSGEITDSNREAASAISAETNNLVASAPPTPSPSASTKENSKDNKTATNNKSPKIQVIYAEINKNLLQSFFEESQLTGQFMSFKDYSAGILPDIAKKISSANGIKILQKQEYNIQIGKNLQWFYGLKDRVDPELEIGMSTFIELSEGEDSTYRGNLQIQRSWREPGPPINPNMIQKKSFPAMFEINATSGFFISGIMPLKSNLENDDELTAIDIYKILKSEEFVRGETDFIIFVELANTSAK